MARKPYTKEQIEYLRKITPGRYNDEITKMFNKKFGTNKSEGAISAVRGRYKIRSGIDSRFKKNHTPWNKGTKGLTKANKTSFKKGQAPTKHRPVGSERICSKDGYILVKIKEPNVWEHKHRLIWEHKHGPTPEGHVIIFGDGNKRNFNIDNLICVSRGQLLRLNQNGLIKNDADLTRVGINIVNLKQKINERKVD